MALSHDEKKEMLGNWNPYIGDGIAIIREACNRFKSNFGKNVTVEEIGTESTMVAFG